jgi:serine/threonine protein kinase
MVRELQPGDPQVIGPYRLRGQLGAGGMGRVFLGLSAEGQLAAVKVIRADLATDPEFRARFEREIAVARRVSSLFTAPVLGADLDGPVPWLATAYVDGPSLADAVAERGPLPVASVLRLAAGLAESLSAIHAAGVVHRDLKPSNVLLAKDRPRVIDFGISRATEVSSLTRTGLVVGSPGFMSPEQAEGRDVGPAGDIFSLGAVLAFAATGVGPFGAGSTPALVYRALFEPASLDHVPAEVRGLVDRCLAKDPGQRPTAREILAGTGVVQPEPGLPTVMDRPAADASMTVTAAQLPVFTAPAAGQPQPHEERPRHRRRRLALAAVIVGFLAASATGGIALSASAHQSPVAHSGQARPARMPSTATSTPRTPVSISTSPPASAVPTTAPAATPSATMPATATMSPSPAPTGTTSPGPSASTTPSAATPPSSAPTPTGSSAPSGSAAPGPTGAAVPQG